jgi:glycyl-tRNA synthetase beta chain
LALLGGEVVPVSFGGFRAGRVTYGHRVLADGAAIEIAARDGLAGAYEQALLGAHVIADVEARRHTIRKSLDRVCRTLSVDMANRPRWREDHALVDKLTHLTEWPTVIAGGFEREYLELPEEVLVTVMRDHQSYFAVDAGAAAAGGGRLAPHFLAVLNTETDAAGEAVIRHGNERVLRARFNDARFFWEFDQRVPLRERVKLLEKVTFQKDLGSYAAKTERVRTVAKALAEKAAARGLVVDAAAVDEAAALAKADLTTELVKEFTELQGEVGGLYARAQGVGERVAEGIYDQYRPKSMEDRIPRTPEGQLLSIADKADTVAGMFGLGLEPTGSKDPFALRRAANGVVKILGEGVLPLTLGDVANAATPVEAVRMKVEVFFAERLEFYLREAKGQAYDVVKAVLAAGANDVRDAVARAEAVTAVRGSEDFAAVCAAFKRMRNILNQAQERGEDSTRAVGGAAVPMELEELCAAALRVKSEVQALQRERQYGVAFQKIATLRPLVDVVFEKVMILDSNPLTRRFNLASLSEIVSYIGVIADLSEIVVVG